MEYIIVPEAAEKWGMSERSITYHLAAGRIPGSMKKGRFWLIPENAVKPEDKRRKRFPCKRKQKPLFNCRQHLQKMRIYLCKSSSTFPIRCISAPDGIMLFANEAFFQFVKAPTGELIKGNNIRNNPNLDRWGVKDFVMRSYQGEVVHAYDVRVPLQELIAKYGGNADLLSESLYHNMTAFPIYDAQHQLAYVVTFFPHPAIIRAEEK